MLLNLADFEEAARDSLSPMAYDYYAGGSDDEVTVRRNRDAFEAISLAPRVLVGVSTVDTVSAVLGRQVSMPVLLAPTSAHKLAHPQGELATAAAAGRAGTVMVLSTLSTVAVEEGIRSTYPWYAEYFGARSRDIPIAMNLESTWGRSNTGPSEL